MKGTNAKLSLIKTGQCPPTKDKRRKNDQQKQIETPHNIWDPFGCSDCLYASTCLTQSQASFDPNTQFYVPKPNHGAIQQIADLTSSGERDDANLIKTMIE